MLPKVFSGVVRHLLAFCYFLFLFHIVANPFHVGSSLIHNQQNLARVLLQDHTFLTFIFFFLTRLILLTPWTSVLVKLIVAQVAKFPAIYRTRKFINMFPRYLRNPVHTLPSYFSKIRFNIILPFTRRPPTGLFPSGFPINKM
jgi:hypothetical protein